ncbi:conserved hypothetical protein [Cellulomonas flavigena DSM 20109]|uniref:DUF4229 domain-containing protein n=1 Tax=Cellulomonas flavigena (strain ATCC 482 / DSM 20109 / BCRC 11376 / JCM 18109 / NBRC 3775 / NCIMB 8073 / NRS 134) TaxID=446466 RepID=D5UJH7_CELFN|nr:DUF4229 domain-containing protein [Cellulomonas flavigena]ADG75615.1 conserved hypothetical protein [Cellulomonas flavigena DSM 20109]
MPVLVYSLLRAALFLAATGLLWWAGMRSWLAPVLGAVVAWALSYVLLARQRDAAARHLAQRAEGRRAARGSDVDAAAEDAEAEGRGPQR